MYPDSQESVNSSALIWRKNKIYIYLTSPRLISFSYSDDMRGVWTRIQSELDKLINWMRFWTRLRLFREHGEPVEMWQLWSGVLWQKITHRLISADHVDPRHVVWHLNVLRRALDSTCSCPPAVTGKLTLKIKYTHSSSVNIRYQTSHVIRSCVLSRGWRL